MKKRTTPIRLGVIKYLLLLPVFLFVNCENDTEEPLLGSETKLTQDSKVLSLMKAAIYTESNDSSTAYKGVLSKSADTTVDDQCTYFQYPMTFEVYSGDNPTPVLWEINSDEELLEFIDILEASATTYEYYIFFPITLLDTEGSETILEDLTELEGTLQMAVEACESMSNDPSDGSDGTDGSNGGTDLGGSTDESTGDSGSNDSGSGGDTSGDDTSGGDGSGGDSSDNDDSSEESDVVSVTTQSDNNEESIEMSNSDDEKDHICDKKGKKVLICHKGKTICVSVNARWGHMQHHEEDYFGSCED